MIDNLFVRVLIMNIQVSMYECMCVYIDKQRVYQLFFKKEEYCYNVKD